MKKILFFLLVVFNAGIAKAQLTIRLLTFPKKEKWLPGSNTADSELLHRFIFNAWAGVGGIPSKDYCPVLIVTSPLKNKSCL